MEGPRGEHMIWKLYLEILGLEESVAVPSWDGAKDSLHIYLLAY